MRGRILRREGGSSPGRKQRRHRRLGVDEDYTQGRPLCSTIAPQPWAPRRIVGWRAGLALHRGTFRASLGRRWAADEKQILRSAHDDRRGMEDDFGPAREVTSAFHAPPT